MDLDEPMEAPVPSIPVRSVTRRIDAHILT